MFFYNICYILPIDYTNMEIEEIRSIFVELTKNYNCIISKNPDENITGISFNSYCFY